MSDGSVMLRAYAPSDEDAAIELWRATWQEAYPTIDFTARLLWWRERWRTELVPQSTIVVAEIDGRIVGFVTVDPTTGLLDQLVVAPECWGLGIADALMAEAKRIAPQGLELLVNRDNARAIGFYRKQGFADAGPDVNPVSGRPVNRMRWPG